MKVKVYVQVTLTINFMRRGVSAGFVAEKVRKCPVDGKRQLRLILLFIIRDLNTVNYRGSNRLLAYIRRIAHDNIKAILLAFKDFHESDIPDEGHFSGGTKRLF